MPDKAHSSWINYIYEHVLPSTFSCSVYWHYFVNAWVFGWYKLATPLVIINTVLDIYILYIYIYIYIKPLGVILLLYHLSLAKFIPGLLVHWWKFFTFELLLLVSICFLSTYMNWFLFKINQQHIPDTKNERYLQVSRIFWYTNVKK